jgi:ABC-type transporter Mla subunit MlaD
MAAHNADTAQFLADLAALSGELSGRAGDIVAGAQDLNQALPVLNQRGPELTNLLLEAARLSSDAADLLDANREFLTKSITEGGETIQLLFDHRNDIVPLVVGLREYVQTLVEVGHFRLPDGTLMAAVKGILGGDACTSIPGCPALTMASQETPAAATPAVETPAAPAPGLIGALIAPIEKVAPNVAAPAQDLTGIVLGLVKHS